METFTLEQASYLAEIIGVIAVIISIIYLGFQVKQNTKVIALGTVHSICSAFREQYENISTDKQVADVFLRGLVDTDEIDGAELMQFHAIMHDLFRVYEDSFYQYKQGALDPEIWKGISRQLVELGSQKGMREYWQKRKIFYHDAFQIEVDNEVFAKEPSPNFKLAGT